MTKKNKDALSLRESDDGRVWIVLNPRLDLFASLFPSVRSDGATDVTDEYLTIERKRRKRAKR